MALSGTKKAHRFAYSPALTPSTREKVRRIESADWKPEVSAISFEILYLRPLDLSVDETMH